MADETSIENQELVEVTLIEPENIPVFYANLCGIATSPEEIIFTFAQRDLSNPAQAMGVVRIYTSPGHGHRIAEVLSRLMEEHRERSIAILPSEIRAVVEKQNKSGKKKTKRSADDE